MSKRGCASVFRAFTAVSSILAILLALACIGLIIYGYVYLQKLWSTLGTLGLVALILLLIAVTLIVVTGVFGLCGSICGRHNATCCLTLFFILALIWCAVMVGVGIAAIVVPPKYFSTSDDSKCLKISSFQRLQSFSQAALNSICVSCACYFPNSANSAVYSPQQTIRLQTVEAPLLSTTDSTLPVKAQSCSGWDSSSLSQGTTIYEEFQKKFKCTGWCANTSSLYYRFTNVNNGRPQYTCYARASHYIRYYGTILAIMAFLMAGFMLVGAISAIIYLCFAPSDSELQTPVEPQPTNQNLRIMQPVQYHHYHGRQIKPIPYGY